MQAQRAPLASPSKLAHANCRSSKLPLAARRPQRQRPISYVYCVRIVRANSVIQMTPAAGGAPIQLGPTGPQLATGREGRSSTSARLPSIQAGRHDNCVGAVVERPQAKGRQLLKGQLRTSRPTRHCKPNCSLAASWSKLLELPAARDHLLSGGHSWRKRNSRATSRQSPVAS